MSTTGLTWENLAQRLEQSRSLSPTDRARERASLSRLASFFGDEWLRGPFREGHSLATTLQNLAPWRVLWLEDFTTILEHLAKDPSFTDLLHRLKDINEYRGAEAEVEVAGKLIESGLPVRLFEAPEQGESGPDLVTEVDGKTLFVEVTALREPEEYDRASKTFGRISELFLRLPFSVSHSCKIYRPLSEPHLREIMAALRWASAEVQEGRVAVREVKEDGVIEAYIYRTESREMIPERMRGIALEGPELPPLDIEIWRLHKIIREEAKQIPKGEAGMLVIKDQNLIVMSLRAGFYRNLAANICETVYDQSRLCLAAVSVEYLSIPVTEVETELDYYLIRRGRYDGTYQDDLLLLPNRYGAIPDLGRRLAKKLAQK